MPTVIAALEYLVGVTAEHLANLDQGSAGCATPIIVDRYLDIEPRIRVQNS
jgi:hypothetical protein